MSHINYEDRWVQCLCLPYQSLLWMLALFLMANPKLKSLYFADAVIPGSTQGHRQEMLEGAAALKVSLCPQQQRVC